MSTDDEATGTRLLESGLVGRDATRVLVDFAVMLQFAHPDSEVKFETPRELSGPSGSVRVEPETLATSQHAGRVLALFRQTVRRVRIEPGSVLKIEFESGDHVLAQPDGQCEAWSYVDDDGGRVVCIPSGGLAWWSRRTKPHN